MTEFRIIKSPAIRYAAMVTLPLAALLFQPAVYFAVLELGHRVLLETRPVDPRDLLRGDYVILDYKISDVPDGLLLTSAEFLDDDRYEAEYPVYVTLGLNADGVASVSGISARRPSDGIYLKGRLERLWGSNYSIDYGLGAYYVPEDTGRELEDAIRGGEETVLADVRVLLGRGVIKELLRKK
jgi:uncharacterized membrane-anchored protein